MTLLTCPPDDRLKHYAQGQLAETDAAEVDSHLAACAACLRRLESLPESSDDFVREVRGLAGRRPPRNPVLDQLRERLRTLTGPAAGEITTDVSAPTGPYPVAATPVDYKTLLAPAQQPDELGRLGPYRVLQVLGAGGMGVVFRAEDTSLQRPVALKVLKPELSANADFRQRFLREARMAAQLQHDHVVTIYQAGEESGVPLVAMQLLEGESLEHRLRRDGKLPVAEVLRIGREVAAGLQAAHARGLIHRDIKPANLWLEQGSGRVKILDFGLARPATEDDSHLTQTGTVLGTPAYMAPEQAEGRPLDGRADLFSLGCVLYRLATGVPAFRGKTPLAVMKAVTTEEPPPAITVNPEMPPALSELIQRLLAKNTSDRPTNAQGVIDMLILIEPTARFTGGGITLIPHAIPVLEYRESPRPGSAFRLLILPAVAAGLLAVVAGGWLLAALLFPATTDAPNSAPPGQPGAQGEAPKTPVSPPLSLVSLVSAPTQIKGLKSWDIETTTEGGVARLRYDSSGRYLSVWNHDGAFRGSWDFTKGTMVPRETHAPLALDTVASPDGKVLARIKDNTVELLEPNNAKPNFTVRGLSRPLDLLFSPDSKTLVIANWDGGIVLVDANRKSKPLQKGAVVHHVIGWLSDRKTLVAVATRSSTENALIFVNIDNDTWNKAYEARSVHSFAQVLHKPVVVDAGGKWLAAITPNTQVVVWDLTTGKEKRTFKDYLAGGLACSRDQKFLAYRTKDYDLNVVEVATGKATRLRMGGSKKVYDFTFAPDSKTLASSGHDGVIRLWSVATGRQLGTLLLLAKNDWLAISPDGHYRAASGLPVEKTLVYIAEPPVGKLRQLSPSEFAKEYNWKNQPTRVVLTEAAAGRLNLEAIIPKQ
jgi:WD40 repeat protein